MPARKGKHIAKQLYGDRTKGQPSNDIPSKKIKVSHDSHGSLEGAVFVCGSGDVGQLGLGTDVFERTYPGLVNIADSVIQVCAGGMHTVCVTSRGQVYTFGCNDEGGLGRDTSEEGSETKPGLVHGLERVVQVTAGDSHTAALTEDGKVFAFGNYRDANGSIGLTMKGIQRTPVEVLPDMTVVKIASGNDHLVCLTDLGEIYTIGCAEQGQLGRIAECFSARGGRHGLETLLNPGLVRCKKHRTRRLARFVDVWAGQYNTFAKEKDAGDIYSWGLNNYYQLGLGDMANRFVPERSGLLAEHAHKWNVISGGQHHTIALDEVGHVFTFGRADYGRLGLGESATERPTPTHVKALTAQRCNGIAAGGCVSFAWTDKGNLYSWGMGTNQQLGHASDKDVWLPMLIKGKQLQSRCGLMISSGGQHSVFLARSLPTLNGEL